MEDFTAAAGTYTATHRRNTAGKANGKNRHGL